MVRIQSPRKRRRDEERKYTCDGALHTEQHHTYVCAGGLSSPSGRCHPPGGAQTTREAGQDSQAVCTQEARATSQAGKPSRRRD